MLTTRFCFVRHGETDWNAGKRLQGQIDIDLNAVGEQQARAVRPGLDEYHFAAAYSSDLVRAWRTALLATEGLPLTVLPARALRERHYGIYQGLTGDEAAARYPEVHRLHRERCLDYDYASGESLTTFSARVMDGLAELGRRHAGRLVLIFTHGGVLDVVYRQATGRPLTTPRDFPVTNGAINWLEYGPEVALNHESRWRLISWGDRRHLEQSLDELVE